MPPRTSTPAIEVEGLTKRYRRVVAVDRLSFTIPAGSITGLLGGNGAGKTTTIGLLLGLVLPSAGSIRVLGTDILTQRHHILHRMNFESPHVALPQRLTVRQNLRVFGMLYGVSDVQGRIEQLASELALGPLLDVRVGSLSAGQKTRVALAKAL